MHGSGHNRRRRKGRKTLLFPPGYSVLFSHSGRRKGRQAGREGAKETRKRGAVTFATKKWGIHQ